jgi:transposase
MPRERNQDGSHASRNALPDRAPVVRDFLDLIGYRYLDTLEEDEDHVLLLAELVDHLESCSNPRCGTMRPLESHGSYDREFDDWDHGKRRVIQVKVRRWMCLDCRKTCSDELPGLDLAFEATRRLTESIEHQLDLRKSYTLIAVETCLSLATIRRIAIRLRLTRQAINCTTAPEEAGFDGKMFLGVYRFVATKTRERRVWELLKDTTNVSIELFFASIKNREALLKVNIDFALDLKGLVKKWFPNAVVVIDRYHVMHLLVEHFGKLRVAEGNRAAKRAVEELGTRMELPSDPTERTALEKKTRRQANKRVACLKRDRRLFNAPRSELSIAEDIRVQAWLGEMPVLKEGYGLIQNMHRLYRHNTSPETAAALMNRWFERLSPSVMKSLRPFVKRVRKHLPDVCAFWLTRSTNGYTEAVNDTLEDIERTRGNISFESARDIFLYSTSPTSVLQLRRAKRQEERFPGKVHASVHPRRRPRGERKFKPELHKPKRHRRRSKESKRSKSLDQLGLSPELCPEIAEESI